MADNYQITQGSGTTVATDDVAGAHVQKMKLLDGTADSATAIAGDAVNGLDVDVTRVQGSVTVIDGGGTLSVDDNGAAISVDDNAGSLTVDSAQLPAALVGGRLDVNIGASGATVPVSDNAGSLTVDSAQLPSALVGGRLDVNIGAAAAVPVTDNASSLTVDDGGLTLSVDDGAGSLTVDGTVTGNQGSPVAIASAWPIKLTDGSVAAGISDVAGAKALKVDVIQAVGSAVQTDKAAFVEGTGKVDVIAGVFNETPASDPTEDQAAAIRITAKRAQHVNLRNNSGTELGTSGAPVRTDPTGATTQPVSGTVTSNQGTAHATEHWKVNLNQVGGTAVGTVAAGVQKVGIVDEANAAFAHNNALPTEAVPHSESAQWRDSKAYTASQTAQAIRTPTGGKKFVVLGVIVTPTGSGPLTIYDDSDVSTNYLWKGTPSVGASVVLMFHTPWSSSAINQVLRYTSGAGATGQITAYGYEV